MYEIATYIQRYEYEHTILITVRHPKHLRVQFASLGIDPDRLAAGQWERSGPAVLVDVLEGVLLEANMIFDAAKAIQLPQSTP
jgi:hypothetical protein